jgi:hypothetical protein
MRARAVSAADASLSAQRADLRHPPANHVASMARDAIGVVREAAETIQKLRDAIRQHELAAFGYKTEIDRQRHAFRHELDAMNARVSDARDATDESDRRALNAQAMTDLAAEHLADAEQQRDVAIDMSRLAEQRAQRAERLLAALIGTVEEEFRQIEAGAP